MDVQPAELCDLVARAEQNLRQGLVVGAVAIAGLEPCTAHQLDRQGVPVLGLL